MKRKNQIQPIASGSFSAEIPSPEMNHPAQEKSFKTFIRDHVTRKRVSPALIELIKDKIRISPA